MESIVPATTTAMPSVTPATLVAAFATIPDPRRAASVVYPLPAMLALTVAALLPTSEPSGDLHYRSVAALGAWSEDNRPPSFLPM